MTKEEAIAILLDMANELQLFPESKQGQAFKMAIEALNQQREDKWTIKQYQVPIENKQIPTIAGTVLSGEPTACKIVYTYTHSACKSEEYLNKYKFCPNCGAKMKVDE